MEDSHLISVIIPTYKSPKALDLCLKSAIKGQSQNNQIIVVVDGFYDLNKEVLEKWEDSIEILTLETNQGLCRGTNLGVYNAKHTRILIVNDDNVFPRAWDVHLNREWQDNAVITPNQIEPYSSIFKQFVIEDLGRTVAEFDLEAFWQYEYHYASGDKQDESGSTLPIFMNKYDYLRVGGWDENYELGMVADWDFFLKCSISGLKMIRTWNVHFYHFVSLSTLTPEKESERHQSERNGHEYAKYKWGSYIYSNPETNQKFIL